MEIETKTASLETFSVTIRALHVSNRQMTLAVFRQLPVRPEEKDDEKWGIVRYTIKETGDIWLVYSSSGSLYRRALDPVARVWDATEGIDRRRKWIATEDEEIAGLIDSRYDALRERKTNQRNEWAEGIVTRLESIEKEHTRANKDHAIVSTLPQLFIAV